VADLKGPSIGAVWSEGSSALIYQLVAQAIFTSRPGSGKLLRAAASKSDKTNDFKIGWWIGVV